MLTGEMTTHTARLAHVGVAVSSIADALAFYRDVLGLEPGRPESADGATIVGLTLGDVQVELLALERERRERHGRPAVGDREAAAVLDGAEQAALAREEGRLIRTRRRARGRRRRGAARGDQREHEGQGGLHPRARANRATRSLITCEVPVMSRTP